MSQKISHTAAFITVKFYGLTLFKPFKSLFSEKIIEFYGNIVQQLPKHLSWYYRTLKSKWWRRFFIWSEELLLPGDLMHIIGRKYYIIQELDKAIEEGYKQIVVLGSGFDHSAWYSSTKLCLSIEIDTELMISEKKRFLDHGKYLNPNLHLLPIDVTKQSITDILNDLEEYDPNKPTAFIAEGFFDYLTYDVAKDVLNQIRGLSSNARLITTIFSLDELNIFYRSSFTSGVAMVGEAIKLPLNFQGFRDLLTETGFDKQSSVNYTDMEEKLFKPHGIKYSVLNGFYVLTAE